MPHRSAFNFEIAKTSFTKDVKEPDVRSVSFLYSHWKSGVRNELGKNYKGTRK